MKFKQDRGIDIAQTWSVLTGNAFHLLLLQAWNCSNTLCALGHSRRKGIIQATHWTARLAEQPTVQCDVLCFAGERNRSGSKQSHLVWRPFHICCTLLRICCRDTPNNKVCHCWLRTVYRRVTCDIRCIWNKCRARNYPCATIPAFTKTKSSIGTS